MYVRYKTTEVIVLHNLKKYGHLQNNTLCQIFFSWIDLYCYITPRDCLSKTRVMSISRTRGLRQWHIKSVHGHRDLHLLTSNNLVSQLHHWPVGQLVNWPITPQEDRSPWDLQWPKQSIEISFTAFFHFSWYWFEVPLLCIFLSVLVSHWIFKHSCQRICALS